MKKGFIAFLFVCACALGFSYGYRGTYWGETFQELQLKTRIIKTKEYQDYTFLSENARMLGQPTSIHYAFRNMRLMSIVYSVNDTEESVEMLNNILDTKKLRLRKRYKAEWDEVYIFRNILDNYITFVYTQKQSEF